MVASRLKILLVLTAALIVPAGASPTGGVHAASASQLQSQAAQLKQQVAAEAAQADAQKGVAQRAAASVVQVSGQVGLTDLRQRVGHPSRRKPPEWVP